jgi:hypothetical protein
MVYFSPGLTAKLLVLIQNLGFFKILKLGVSNIDFNREIKKEGEGQK